MASVSIILFTLSIFCLACASSEDPSRLNLDFDEAQSCKDSCDRYAIQAGGKGNAAECCARGCRFFSILSFIHHHRDSNTTKANCDANCEEAYSRQTDRQACQWGCRSQQDSPLAARGKSPQREPEEEEEEVAMTHMLYPLLYMHSVYSNMLDKVHSRMAVSWSLFTQPGSGELVVIRSQPRIIEFVAADTQDGDEGASSMDAKTSAYVETNIVSQDNSATPLLNFRASQMRAAHLADPDSKELGLDVEDRAGRLDWFTCVVKKTDIARVVLCLLILSTAVVMIWFCLSAASTAPEQHLSINGDLDYLRRLGEKDSFRLLHPQHPRVDARPLPIKIRVEQI